MSGTRLTNELDDELERYVALLFVPRSLVHFDIANFYVKMGKTAWKYYSD